MIRIEAVPTLSQPGWMYRYQSGSLISTAGSVTTALIGVWQPGQTTETASLSRYVAGASRVRHPQCAHVMVMLIVARGVMFLPQVPGLQVERLHTGLIRTCRYEGDDVGRSTLTLAAS